MLDRTLANLDFLSKDPAHAGQVSTIAATAAHNVRQHLAASADERATLMGMVLVARADDDAKLGAYVRGRLIALGLLEEPRRALQAAQPAR